MDILYRLLAYVGAVALIFGAGWSYRGRVDADAYQAKVAASLVEDRAVETEWQDKFNFNARHLIDALNSIAVDRDRFSAELRKRPGRHAGVSEGARPECQGGTGAELSGPDAEFLAREAARAEEQRAALMACYAAMDMLRTD